MSRRPPLRPAIALVVGLIVYLYLHEATTLVAPILRLNTKRTDADGSSTVRIRVNKQEATSVLTSDLQDPDLTSPLYNSDPQQVPSKDLNDENAIDHPSSLDPNALPHGVQFVKERLVRRVLSESAKRDVTLEETRAKIRLLWKQEWSSYEWISNKQVLYEAMERQNQFLQSPKTFRPQPVVYRPILGGMGWGNLAYDISFHVVFAFMLKRPLLIMFDKKDPFGKLGWNATNSDEEGVFTPRLFDWRWAGKDKLFRLYNPEELSRPGNNDSIHELVTCRSGYALHERCGGDQSRGNLEPLLGYFNDIPHKVLYSEFSASFIMPLTNSRSYREWIKVNLSPSVNPPLAAQLRFAFNVLFKVNQTFYDTRVFPHLRRVSKDFTEPFQTVHVRTGHLETGVARAQSLESDVTALETCRDAHPNNHTWIVLTDNAELAWRVSNWSHITVDKGFSLQRYHVGYSSSRHQGEAWEVSLRDWLLLVESTGPVMLRSRMPSAFSFGERGAYIGGLTCKTPAKDRPAACADNFFDKVCFHY